jgi:hypothetical protein
LRLEHVLAWSWEYIAIPISVHIFFHDAYNVADLFFELLQSCVILVLTGLDG